jgi:hypothetical protein
MKREMQNEKPLFFLRLSPGVLFALVMGKWMDWLVEKPVEANVNKR